MVARRPDRSPTPTPIPKTAAGTPRRHAGHATGRSPIATTSTRACTASTSRRGKSDLVTRTDLTVHDFDFSPDSQQFVIGAASTPTIDDSFMGVRLYIVPAAGGMPEPFVKTEGKLQFPRWSPDGRSIAWLGATTVDDPFAGSVFIAPVRRSSGAADRANVTAGRSRARGLWLGWQPGQPDTLTFLARRTAGRALLHDCRRRARRSRRLHATGDRSGRHAELLDRRQARRASLRTRPGTRSEVFAGDHRRAKRVTTLEPAARGRPARRAGSRHLEGEGRAGDRRRAREARRLPRRRPLSARRCSRTAGPKPADPNGWNGSVLPVGPDARRRRITSPSTRTTAARLAAASRSPKPITAI